MAHDVFVSHSSKDKPTADAVCAMLESQGIRCWVAPRDITPGMDWGEAIVDAIKGARVMVLVFSTSANNSPQIKREVERAVNKGIPVIPLRIEDVAPTASLEYFISTPHWLDAFTPPLEGHLRYLAQIIQRILGTQRGAIESPLSGQRVAAAGPAPNEPQAKTQNSRRAPPIVLIAAASALLIISLAGWWFGLERPRRMESKRQIEAERTARAKAESEALRMAEEQLKMKAAIEAAMRAEEKRLAEVAAAKFAAEKSLAEETARLAALEKQKEEEAAKQAEAKRIAEAAVAELAKKEADQKARDLAALQTKLTPNVPVVETSQNVPVVEANLLKPAMRVLNMIKNANDLVGSQMKDKVVCVYSDRQNYETIPSTWHVVYYDSSKLFTKATEVTFRGEQKGEVGGSGRILEGFSGSAKNVFDKSKIQFDTDAALRIAMANQSPKDPTLKASQMRLQLSDGTLVWEIDLRAPRLRNPREFVDIGKIFISAEDGKIVRNESNLDRAR